jgi:hypothetical protein
MAGIWQRRKYAFQGHCMGCDQPREQTMIVGAKRAAQAPILSLAGPAAPVREPDARQYSRRQSECYLGSWAKQMVVARLAMNRTRNATRMTTTPPTVSRSQKSEPSRIRNSRFTGMTIVLMSNFTARTEVCSDHDHIGSMGYPVTLKRRGQPAGPHIPF